MQHVSSQLQGLMASVIAALRRVRLQPRLFVSFLGVSLIPVVLYSLYAYHVYSDSIRSKVGEYAQQSAKLLNRNLQLELEKYGYYLNSLSVMQEVQQLMASPQNAEEDSAEKTHKLMQELKGSASAGPYLRETQIVSMDGRLLYNSGYESVTNTIYRELLADIDQASPNDSLQYVVSRHTDSGNLVLGRRIYRYTTALEPTGYILVYINARPLAEQIFQGVDFGPDSAVFLMASDGTILASNSEAQIPGDDLSEEQIYRQIKDETDTAHGSFTSKLDGGSFLTVSNYNPSYDCYFVVTVPESYIQNEIRGIATNLVLLAAVLFVVSFAAALLVYSSIIMPLKHIVCCCNTLADEDVDKTIGDTSPDEMGFLARTLDNLIGELKRMARQWQKDQERKRELELESLRYQINPHFLFNTLNSLQWLANLNDVPVLYDGIGSLSALLQSTLIKNEEFLPLEEEVQNLTHYFSIQKIRYGDQFDVTYEIEQQLRQYRVPRFILQPLAENAVLHGIDGVHIMHITVKACLGQDKSVMLGILDDGKGFEQDKTQKEDREKFSGIGIPNVSERLRLYYGEEYNLSIQSRPGEGTQCWIRLPLSGGQDAAKQLGGEEK